MKTSDELLTKIRAGAARHLAKYVETDGADGYIYKGAPILILTAEASYHAPYDHCTVKYLEQAGLHPAWTKLAEVGIHGNGHMMMLETNNLEIAAVISRWLDKALRVR